MDRMFSTNEDEVASKLFSACSLGDADAVKHLLKTEPYTNTIMNMTNSKDPNAKMVAEKTIYTAALKGHYDVVKLLLKGNANANVNTGFGTPIYAAVKGGSLDLVRLLIEYGADYRTVKGGFSPLFVACIEGRLNILKYLVNIGANLYAFDNPPLIFTACSAGQLAVVKYLMEEMEFDIHRTLRGEDALKTDGRDTLLYCACSRNKIEVASYLVQQGALITQTLASKFPAIIKGIIHQKFRPLGKPEPVQLYHAKLKELGLAEIPWSFLADYSTTITRLELRSNYLTSLPDKLFQMPSLKILDISHNRLPEICQEDIAWQCVSLADFDCSHNQITYIPSGLFKLPELTNLLLSYNLLTHLPGDPEDASAQTTSGLPNDVRWECEKLKKLDFSHNRLRALPDTFNDLRSLNVMNLSHNYLKELPQSCSWGCINLVHLDGSHNHLVDLPIGASNYWMHSLERLYVAHNYITEISRNITELTHLTVLDLSHNKIKYLPPTSYWTGNRMNKLNLGFNDLSVLSHRLEEEQSSAKTAADQSQETTRHASTVKSIIGGVLGGGASRKQKKIRPTAAGAGLELTDTGPVDDQPRELPTELWGSCLQSLYLQNNHIKWLPDYIGKFSGLARLDLSSNSDIHLLPLTLGRLRNCWELILHGLKIFNVPQHLMPGVTRGGSTKHLLAYLRAQLRHCVPYSRMKLMLVGLQGRGKTTLLSVLRSPGSSLPENVSTVGVEVAEWVVHPPVGVKRKGGTSSQRHQMEVTFSAWDLAGQEVYYATHQCFLSRNTLYLVVWSMEEGDKGIDYLRPWLLNIQARAPHSPVLIVGTHLDRLPPSRANSLKDQYWHKIKALYDKPGYPRISSIVMVSCTTGVGIKELQERIHHAAISAVDYDTKEHIIGMQVPASYVALQRLIAEEVRVCQVKGIPPVLNQKEFAALSDFIPDSDISDPEELSLAAQFLHDNGVLLHYNDHLRGLNNLYFIDPVWLADMLAEVVTIPERQSFVHNGILKESNVAFIFRDSRRFPSKFFSQYLQLLERFEIALSLGNGMRLIPSMLPFQRPVMNFVDPEPISVQQAEVEDKLMFRKSILSSSSSEGEAPKPADLSSPRMVNGVKVIDTTVTCIRRRYRMAYIPSGYWSRLISRLIINLKRSGLVETPSSSSQSPPIIYWRRGIVVLHSTGRFLVESIQSVAQVAGGIGDQMLEASAKYVGEGVDKLTTGPQGVDIQVWSSCGDFSAMGYVVDQLDSLIDEWFPGLNDIDVEGEWLVQRQVLWKIPAEVLKSFEEKQEQVKEKKKQVWDFVTETDQSRGEVFIFQLEHCAAEALIGDTILCPDYNVRIPLHHLVPDLLLTDLPAALKIDTSQFEFNPQDPATKLGRGGAGAVYRGKYRREVIAVKEFLTASQAERTGDTDISQRPFDPDDDVITSGEALFLFRDLRQEVTVLAQLSHPYVVSLLGVSIRPMCMVIEYAPMGSLFGILDKKVEQFKAVQANRASVILRMPGGVLGHEVSIRIALQVALALRYLHNHGIVYRDLKSDNVLIWSLEIEDPINAKLADYGISRFANPGGVKGEEGTPGYLAPEAIRRRGEDQAFDEKVDIFSYAMMLFELLTGQRPFENLSTTQELNRAVIQGERPLVSDGNAEHAFPAMMDLMYDCWKHTSSERPGTDEVVQRISEPGFMCRKHTLFKSKDHPLQKIDTIYARPVLAEDEGPRSYALWTWARQDTERNFSIVDVRKGVFNLPEKQAPGGRVYAMTATGEVEKRIWIGTADHEIQVYGYKSVGEPQCLWTFNMKDSVLALDTEVEEGRVKRVFSSLANGTLCVFSRKSISLQQGPIGDTMLIPEACIIKCDEDQYRAEAEDWSEPLILRLAESGKSAKCMVFVGNDRLWCGCGNTITVVDSINMKVLHNIPVFVKRMALVNELVSNGEKVWGVGRQLSCVMEWDAKTYTLVHVFNCNEIDPTEENIISDPKLFDDLFDPEQKPKSTTLPRAPSGKDNEATTESEGFKIDNDPMTTSITRNSPFSQRGTRKTLRKTVIRPRPRGKNITREANVSVRSRLTTMRNRVLRKQQGSTRTTSLVIVDKTLWVARGMGDILVIDINEDANHGKVLARLATEDCEKYGNRSYHKLVCVGGDYVVSSQWLEPVDIRRGSPTPGGENGRSTLASSFAERQIVAHQAITIWEAWNHKRIEHFMTRRAAMLIQEEDDV